MVNYRLIADLDEWIDSNTSPAFKENPTLALFGRVAKIQEETGEVMEALLGFTGENPRKGFSHTMLDLSGEIADVAITALCALQHIMKDRLAVENFMNAKLDAIHARNIDG